jgi:hypothetical protein
MTSTADVRYSVRGEYGLHRQPERFAEDSMTLLILWNHACNVGVKAMDDQHAIMMDTMNELRLVAIGGNKRRWVSA